MSRAPRICRFILRLFSGSFLLEFWNKFEVNHATITLCMVH
ncbi:hypothetical protein RSAG8_12590, partial [Rhizoctonia solani AG-8 WAC10335]